jgi:hypothetical protein
MAKSGTVCTFLSIYKKPKMAMAATTARAMEYLLKGVMNLN